MPYRLCGRTGPPTCGHAHGTLHRTPKNTAERGANSVSSEPRGDDRDGGVGRQGRQAVGAAAVGAAIVDLGPGRPRGAGGAAAAAAAQPGAAGAAPREQLAHRDDREGAGGVQAAAEEGDEAGDRQPEPPEARGAPAGGGAEGEPRRAPAAAGRAEAELDHVAGRRAVVHELQPRRRGEG